MRSRRGRRTPTASTSRSSPACSPTSASATSQKRDYAGSRQTRFVIFPGSALAKKQPDAIMSAELVETSRLFARMNAKIDPAWAEPIAGDLLKRSYSEPHWERKQGAVIGYEKVTLYGVPIIPRRKVQYSRVDLPYARDLFIRNALVDGDWDARGVDFQKANAALREPARGGRGADAAARHPAGRRGAVRVLRPPPPGRCGEHARLRGVVEGRARRDAGAADHVARRTSSGRPRRPTPTTGTRTPGSRVTRRCGCPTGSSRGTRMTA